MKIISNRLQQNLYILSSFFKKVKDLFSLNRQQAIQFALTTLRATNFLYVGYMAFEHLSSSIEYVQHLRSTEYLYFTWADEIWFLIDRLIISSLYLSAFVFVKYYTDYTTLRVELKWALVYSVICGVCFQIVESLNWNWANNMYTQFIITLISCGIVGYLCVARFIIAMTHKKIL